MPMLPHVGVVAVLIAVLDVVTQLAIVRAIVVVLVEDVVQARLSLCPL